MPIPALPVASAVFTGIKTLLKTKTAQDAIKKYGKKAYDAYKRTNREIDKKLTPKLSKDKLKEKAVKNKQIKISKKIAKEVKKQEKNPLKTRRGAKPFTRTKLGQGQEGQKLLDAAKAKGTLPDEFTIQDVLKFAKKQPDKSLKGNPLRGRITKLKLTGLAGLAGGAAALMRDKKEPKGTTTKTATKTKAQIKKEFDAKFAKERAAGKSSFMFDKKDGKGRRSFSTKRADDRKKFQAAGRGAGKTRLGMKRGGRVKKYV